FKVAVIESNEYGFLVDHAVAITRDVKPLNYQCRRDIFELWTPYITTKHEDDEEDTCSKRKRKRTRTSELNEGEIEGFEHHQKIRDIIATATRTLTCLGRKAGYFVRKKNSILFQETSVATNAKNENIAVNKATCKGKESRYIDGEIIQHSSTSPSLVFLQDGWHILPPETTYLISDASSLQPLVDNAKSKGSFDVLVIDPPWYNKSAKRTSKYSFMSLWQIKSLPVPLVLSHNALVVVWVTNKPKYIRFTREELLPHWGVELLAEWYWVKVTKTGEFVIDLDSPHKKPYETLIIGRFKSTKSSDANLAVSCLSDPKTTDTTDALVFTDEKECREMVNCKEQNGLKSIPNHMVICSVPCQIHSRKPPLSDVLGDYIDKEGRFLEMFARNLTPRWTSWGNEVLKFQHKDYFEGISSITPSSDSS
ncbi:N(6)-adenine-specific DNA methyltransferase METTL4-like, partial [Actinia tenebrosa]|uniref:N(6)-adenine-specific DNA methyltransferase METTL4-like n=1 Tax=Actinia tenebrosa TaxID=6105 RepID=A0A6P8IIH8_ACTTE